MFFLLPLKGSGSALHYFSVFSTEQTERNDKVPNKLRKL